MSALRRRWENTLMVDTDDWFDYGAKDGADRAVPEPRWLCKDGRQLLLREMTTDHLFNCLNKIRREGWRADWQHRMLAELEKRSAVRRTGSLSYEIV